MLLQWSQNNLRIVDIVDLYRKNFIFSNGHGLTYGLIILRPGQGLRSRLRPCLSRHHAMKRRAPVSLYITSVALTMSPIRPPNAATESPLFPKTFISLQSEETRGQVLQCYNSAFGLNILFYIQNKTESSGKCRNARLDPDFSWASRFLACV